jgi:hypothetical protein
MNEWVFKNTFIHISLFHIWFSYSIFFASNTFILRGKRKYMNQTYRVFIALNDFSHLKYSLAILVIIFIIIG